MARQHKWVATEVQEMSDKGGKRWFLVTEVGEQDKIRIRATRANVRGIQGIRGETLKQLQPPHLDDK